MEEIWKDAIGFEGLYQVSNFGRARSIAHEVNCNKGKRRRIICMYGLDGKLIQKYGSLSEAADKNGINAGNISECCRGKRKTAGGFRWEQEDQK